MLSAKAINNLRKFWRPERKYHCNMTLSMDDGTVAFIADKDYECIDVLTTNSELVVCLSSEVSDRHWLSTQWRSLFHNDRRYDVDWRRRRNHKE